MSTILLFLLHVEFMSYIFILVYVGGIVLLFLFVIIMLNLKVESIKNNESFKLLSGSTLLFLVVLKAQSILAMNINIYSSSDIIQEQYLTIKKYHYISNDILNFSLILYTHFFFYLLLVGVILLLAMLGVLILSLNNKPKNSVKKKLLLKNRIPDISILPIENFISFSLVMFVLSMLGISINKQKNFLIVMLFFELMLFSLSLLSITFSVNSYDPQGQIFALFIMSIAVSESAIGLGILISLFRINKRVDFDSFSYLRG
jgi:NADH-quinone oxidoreductase subunit K